MNYCILNLPAHVSTYDGRNDTFLRPLGASVNGEQYQIPPGATTDGLSSPSLVWFILPPFGRKTWGPAAFHDAGYRGALEKWDRAHSRWRKLHSSEYWDDRLLLHLLKSNGVSWPMRYAIYYALRLFGWMAFRTDRLKAALRTRKLAVILGLVIFAAAAEIMVGAGCEAVPQPKSQPAPFSQAKPAPMTPPKGGTPNAEKLSTPPLPPTSVKAANSYSINADSLPAPVYIVSAYFYPVLPNGGVPCVALFASSTDLQTWTIAQQYPYPLDGGYLSCTNPVKPGPMFFLAGYR